MLNGVSIDTMIEVQAYCVDFDMDMKEFMKGLSDKYDERTRHGCYPILYDKWVSEKLKLMRIDKGHVV